MKKIPYQELWNILTIQMQDIEEMYPDFKYKDREEVYSDVYGKILKLMGHNFKGKKSKKSKNPKLPKRAK